MTKTYNQKCFLSSFEETNYFQILDEKDFSKNDNDSLYYSKTDLRESLEEYLDILNMIQRNKKDLEKKIEELSYLEKPETEKKFPKPLNIRKTKKAFRQCENPKKKQKEEEKFELAYTIRDKRREFLSAVLSKEQSKELSQFYSPKQKHRILKQRQKNLPQKKTIEEQFGFTHNQFIIPKSKSVINFQNDKKKSFMTKIKRYFSSYL
ncbi:hypothetical protein M0813_18745 [Anaeramoeba flamelloides]|uniref:Uncharacterized protein n=1 Tax=Anaeramoeba flamelloides TaxID=1746091 RepID=A0ABQ8YRH2_9EUKA|nr:hypothetical protein M0813_18745 [Anaeramoeba flamelloides]